MTNFDKYCRQHETIAVLLDTLTPAEKQRLLDAFNKALDYPNYDPNPIDKVLAELEKPCDTK